MSHKMKFWKSNWATKNIYNYFEKHYSCMIGRCIIRAIYLLIRCMERFKVGGVKTYVWFTLIF